MELLTKNLKNQNLKLYFKYFTVYTFSFLFFIACQKNSSSNDNIATPVVVNPNLVAPGNCAQCNFPQAQLLQATSQGTNSFPVTVNWQLIAEQVKIQQLLAMGWNPQKTYSGIIYARGAMTIASVQNTLYNFNGVLAGLCQIPSGQYTLNPIQPGTMSTGSFELPQFEAIGPSVRIVFQLRSAIVEDPNGDGQVERIAGLLVPMQAFYNGTTVSCNDIGVYIQ